MTRVTLKFGFHKNFKRFLSTSTLKRSNKKAVTLVYRKHNAKEADTSQKSPLIVTHGIMGCKSNWNTISTHISKKLKPLRVVYILDARNHGRSPHNSDMSYEAMAEDLKLFIDTQTPGKQVALMGHSMGGLTNILFALKWPKIVERIIAVDLNPVLPQKDSKFIEYIMSILKRMQEFPITKDNKSLTKERQKLLVFLKKEVNSRRARQFLLKNLIKSKGEIAWQLNIPALIGNKEEFKKFPDLVGGRKYEGPSCFIAGGDSEFLKESHFPEIKKVMPNAEFHVIKNAGHWVHYEKTDEFVQIVSDFLNK